MTRVRSKKDGAERENEVSTLEFRRLTQPITAHEVPQSHDKCTYSFGLRQLTETITTFCYLSLKFGIQATGRLKFLN